MSINPLTVGALASYQNVDPYWSSVSLLMHFDGANNSTTFTDQKGNTPTAQGDPFISTDQYKFGGSSMRCQDNGLGSHGALQFSAWSGLAFGTADYTIEWWQRADSVSAEFVPIDLRTSGSPGATDGPLVFPDSSAAVRIYDGGNTLRVTTASSVLVATTWQAIAVDRYSGTTTVFIDGAVGGTYADSINHPNLPINIGRSVDNTRWITGYIDELRITKGVSRYQGTAYTPATAPFPNG